MSIPGSASPLFFGAGAADAAAFQIDRSLRFNSADSAYLNRTPSSAGNRRTFTWSGWVKRTAMGADKFIFSAGSDPSNMHYLRFKSNDTLEATENKGNSVQSSLVTSAVYRDPSAWYHIVYVYDSTQSTAADRLSLYVNGVEVTAFGTSTYPSQNHDSYINSTSNHYINARPDPAAYSDAYLAEVNLLDGTAVSDASDFGEYDDNNVWQPKDTSGLTFGTNGFRLKFDDNSSNSALGNDSSGNDNDWTVNNISTAGSAWNQSQTWSSSLSSSTGFRGSEPATNAFDGDTSTICSAVNNGVVTFTSPVTFASDSTIRVIVHGGDHTVTVNGGSDQTISAGSYQTVSFTNSSNSTFTMTFQRDSSADTGIRAIEIGGNVLVDSSVVDPNAADIDSLIDTPTNYTADSGNNGGNYATFNPLDKATAGTTTISNGNLDASVQHSGTTYPAARLTISPAQSSGKYQWEVTIGAKTTTYYQMGLNLSPAAYSTGDQHATFRGDGLTSSSLPGSWSGTPPSFTEGDVITVAYDADASNCKFYKNGVLGPTFTLTSIPGNLNFGVWADSNNGYASYSLNAGQRPFAYPVTGYNSLCTTNLPDPTIADGSTAMDAKLYTGNGTSQTITGYGFSPDFAWFKSRNGTDYHALVDTVRGKTKVLFSNTTDDEETRTEGISSFNSDGFSLGDYAPMNKNNDSLVAWAWDAGTSTVSNTDGSITSSVRANQSAGFSIVTFNSGSAGQKTIGHGLGAAPKFIISKDRTNTAPWVNYHKSLGTTSDYLIFATDGKLTVSNIWGSTAPSSTVFGFDSGNNSYANADVVAYCFAPVEGFSAFGSYTGNGSTDGPFVFTGMRPRWLLIKATTGSASWYLYDTARSEFNVTEHALKPNNNDAEGSTSNKLDILSNGFKWRNSGTSSNVSGVEYIYAAFAEHPFKTARAR